MTSHSMAIGDVRCNLLAPLSVPADRPLSVQSNPVVDHRLQVHIMIIFYVRVGRSSSHLSPKQRLMLGCALSRCSE